VCRSKNKEAHVNEFQVKSATASECVDCVLDEYKPVYFNAPIHHLKTVTVKSLNYPKSEHDPRQKSSINYGIRQFPLRLCLDPKDLNQAINRKQWYTRTVDDILPELADLKYFSLLNEKSGYWHVSLDYESSFLTTFNTLWGKYRWLHNYPLGYR